MASPKSYNLVIVESPAKAKTIGQFLGPDYVVTSSYGHIRDLVKNNQAIDVDHNFEPQYVVPDDKEKVVAELTRLARKATAVWLASDEDREGEAISWHLATVLNLPVESTRRIVFHEITKPAILSAITSPRTINMDLVNAQQARRVLDRLVGFELSPVLWRKVKPQLSAGRVQSVAVRLLVEREREIFAYKPTSAFNTIANFTLVDRNGRPHTLLAELGKRFDNEADAQKFIASCAGASFQVDAVEQKLLSRQPTPPFTTSTLQQEAARKLGMSVSQTMQTAQTLYEAGLITYMRTDSVNLSQTALNDAQTVICQSFGKEYHHRRQYKTNTKGAQEAHEAIRPTYMQNRSIEGTATEKRLYQLIWNRAVASQMADAQIERTIISVASPDPKARFVASADIVKFDGFMKLYLESVDDPDDDTLQGTLPNLDLHTPLTLSSLQSRQRFSQHPPRYNEASLVKKLEEMGIGRPSTYAPTISTIQQRGYVIRESRDGLQRSYITLSLNKDGSVSRQEKVENYGAEKNKLFPTDIAMVVTDFLVQHFADVMSYDFTASVETQFDEIAEGKISWQNVIGQFYSPFHNQVSLTLEDSTRSSGERLLGTDPKSGRNVYVRIGRFGPMAQIGDNPSDNAPDAPKPIFSSLRRDQHIETITLDEALRLFDLPRTLGSFEDKEVSVSVGRFGPYIKHDGKFTSLKKTDDPYTISLDDAIARIEEKRLADQNKIIKTFEQDSRLSILNGRWGPYIAFGKANVRIPKSANVETLTYEDCLALASDQGADPDKKASRFARKKSDSQSVDNKELTTSVAKKSKKNATAKTKKS